MAKIIQIKNGGALNTLNKISVIITAGGSSTRFGENKLLYPLDNKPLILNTIEKFINIADEIVISASSEIEKIVAKKYPKIKFAQGGNCRQQSVLNALEKLEYKDYVLIHDGARPFITEEIIKKTIKEVKEKKAVVVGIKAIDTVKIYNKKNEIISTPDRNTLFYAQTPQAFEYDLIYKAHKKFEKELENFTDDSSLLEKLNYKVYFIEGNYSNKKITVKEDLI